MVSFPFWFPFGVQLPQSIVRETLQRKGWGTALRAYNALLKIAQPIAKRLWRHSAWASYTTLTFRSFTQRHWQHFNERFFPIIQSFVGRVMDRCAIGPRGPKALWAILRACKFPQYTTMRATKEERGAHKSKWLFLADVICPELRCGKLTTGVTFNAFSKCHQSENLVQDGRQFCYTQHPFQELSYTLGTK